MRHEEIMSLLGAYSLDAVEPDEAEIVEEHLKQCRICANEVGSYREVAAKLASSTVVAPVHLWERIATSIDEMGSESSLGAPPPPIMLQSHIAKRRSSRRLAMLSGAVAAAVIALLGVDLAHLSSQVSSLKSTVSTQNLSSIASQALMSPSTRQYQLKATNGALLADVAVTSSGGAYLIPRELKKLSPQQTYQLWALSDGRVVSLGVLGSKPTVSWFRLSHPMTLLMLNVEPQGGVTVPDSPAIGQIKMV